MENKIFIFALISFLIILFFRLLRRRESQWIKSRFSKDDILIISYGVKYFGLQNDPNPVKVQSGFLIALNNLIFFKSRWKKNEISIPINKITNISPTAEHKGKRLYQSAIKISFTDKNGAENAAAFKIPYPMQWIKFLEFCRLSWRESMELVQEASKNQNKN